MSVGTDQHKYVTEFFHQQSRMLNVYQIIFSITIRQWRILFWKSGHVECTECLPINPSHLQKIKSQLSSIIHNEDDYNNKREQM